jgi:thioredoxin reductase (NADPH)
MAMMQPDEHLDCLVIGGGPAGLTAALYFARFRRLFLVVDAGQSRAAWIPVSHNLPFFAEGIAGSELLKRQRKHAEHYRAGFVSGRVTALRKAAGCFVAMIETDGTTTERRASRVLLASGAVDVGPSLPDVLDAVQRGLVRYCPICDGYESRDRKIAVLGHGASGLGEASFVARTYSDDVTLLTLGEPMDLSGEQQMEIAKHHIKIVQAPVESLSTEGGSIAAICAGGEPMQFDVLYSALGLRPRTDLALALGAEHDESGNLVVDDHNQTTVRGLYAAGAIVRGLDQIVVAMGHAAVAATAIHNRCEIPTEQEDA